MTMVEPWVYAIDLGDEIEEFDGGEDREIDPRICNAARDPDTHVVPSPNKKRTTKQSRVGHAAVTCYQCNNCIRAFHAFYLGNSSSDGTYSTLSMHSGILTSS